MLTACAESSHLFIVQMRGGNKASIPRKAATELPGVDNAIKNADFENEPTCAVTPDLGEEVYTRDSCFLFSFHFRT